jgi:ankyrin repeat protein
MTEAEDVLKATRVPDTKLFFLGCFDARVTVLSQQRRALNLVDAILSTENLIRPEGRVAVVGGGVAGVTAAAAFAVGAPSLKRIDLFERESELLHLQLHSDRDLHPFIYDWPTAGAADTDAGLPLLNWQANTAKEVAGQILAAFEVIRSRSSNLWVHCSAFAKGVKAYDVGCRLSVDGRTADGGAYDALVLAIGYGYERPSNTGRFDSYWTPSQLLGPAGDSPVIFVSGNGDGGLVDFTMAAFDRMTHAKIIDLVVGHAGLDVLKEELIKIERAAWAAGSTPFDILDRYRQLEIPSALIFNVFDRLRDAEIWFHTREPRMFRKKSAILNRFTAFLAIKADEKFERNQIQVVPAIEHHERPAGEIVLGQATIKPSIPIFRFGPASAENIRPFLPWRDKFFEANPQQVDDYHPALPSLNESAFARFSRFSIRDEPERLPPSPPAPLDPRQRLSDLGIEVKAANLKLYIVSGLEEPVRLLLEVGISPDTLVDEIEPIEWALRQFDSSSDNGPNADPSAFVDPDPARVAVLRALVSAKPRSLGRVAHDALTKPAPARLVGLLQAGVSLDVLDNSGQTLAAHAMRRDHKAPDGLPNYWTELLAREGPRPPPILGTWMLLWAASTGRARLAETLLESGVPVDACLSGQLPEESLEEWERAYWWPGGTALHRLLANGESMQAPFLEEARIYSTTVLRLLLEKGASAGASDAFGRTPLHIAAREGLEEAVTALLAAPGLEISRQNNSRETALLEAVGRRACKRIALKLIPLYLPDDLTERVRLLSHAAASRDEDVLGALLDAGCDPNAGAPGYPGALLALANDPNHLVGRVSSMPCLARLLERGAEPALQDQFGQTALHSFARSKELEAVDRLLGAGADADVPDHRGRTPLMATAAASIAQRLMAAGAQPARRDRYGFDALDHATIYGRDEVVALLEQPDRSARAEARLIRAIRGDDVDAVNALLADGVSANTVGPDGRPVLHTAGIANVAEIMRALLDKGAAVDGLDEEGSTALDQCLWPIKGSWEANSACLTLLIDRGASLDARPDVANARGEAVVFKGFAWWRMAPIAARVLSVCKNARSRKGETSLMMAARCGSAAQVSLLLREGVGANEVDESGHTALHYAADGPGFEDEGEYWEKAKLLTDARAAIDAVDSSGETPLFKAVRSGHGRTIDLLLARGADSTLRNAEGETIAAVALGVRGIDLFNRLRVRLARDESKTRSTAR